MLVSIVIGGMIGLGKTSVADTLNLHFLKQGIDSKVFYEEVDDNPILPLYYELTDEELETRRIPFLLQLFFLNKRFKTVKDCVNWHEPLFTIQDRSIYEDWYFAYVNKSLGRISGLEFKIYEDLAQNMMQELNELPKKAPDLMVYLKGSFETVLDRIMSRGRSFEINPELKEYYFEVWKGYDDWVINKYDASEVLIIDMDKTDVVKRPEDALKICNQVEKKLIQILKIETQIG
ncbi:deoxynucleoside kinase [Bacillus sp. EB600]|nr:deoxynucleoside kinase [Bacillus sp. EB600]MCQ6282740.1 deoxynucleoside kinase [Bacillus sp. EB600]